VTRYYPTDLLLAVERVEAELAAPASAAAKLLHDNGVPELAALFAADELRDGLDELFGGLSQFPWRPLIDTNDVCEYSPAGIVVLDDRAAAATLRGLLLGWAAGNEVVIRSARRPFWRELIGLVRGQGPALPEARTARADADVAGTVVVVPEIAFDGGADPARLAVRVDPAREARELAVLVLDCRSAWVHQLYRTEYLLGTSLSAARSRDTAEERGRLDAKLRYVVERARRAPFFRELPPVAGLDELGKLPIMEKSDIEAHSLPRSRDLSSGDIPTGEVLQSGGSSGTPRYIVYSRTDWHNMVREAIPLFHALGLAKGDRLINTLYGGSLYGGMTTTVTELSRMPVECYTTGQHITVDDLLLLCDKFDANAILAMPALLLPLLRQAKERRPGLRIEKVIYGGTPMSEVDKTWLREHLGTRVISSILAANDGAQLGYQCGELGGRLHHTSPDYNLIEVVDEAGNPLPEGEMGDLLITGMQKFEGPLLRYRIGDCGRVFRHECACGVSGPVLEFAGRTDGLIKIYPSRVLHADVLAGLGVFGVSQLQIEITPSDAGEIVVVRTESPRVLDPGEVRAFLTKEFPPLSPPDSGDGPSALHVECFAEGKLPRHAVSGKIKTVVDNRLR
jgi:phenylacetate-coenzyme A ligase PaaK-like adenylate-forming protein